MGLTSLRCHPASGWGAQRSGRSRLFVADL